MERTVKISSTQLFILIVFFELGSSVVVGLALSAGQAAWISILIGMIGGLVLFWLFSEIHRRSPAQSYEEVLIHSFGKWIGKMIGFVYAIYFIYLASRVLRDFGELLLSATLVETPMFVILTVMILASFYVVFKGIDVLARTSEFYFPILVVLVLLGIVLLFAAKAMDLRNLLPVLGNGWGSILKTSFPLTLTFPFGELITFLVLFKYANQPLNVRKVGMSAVLVSGLVLACTTAIDIAVIGAETAGRTTFPLLMTLSRIQIGEFLQRLDAIGVFILIIGIFFKVSVFYFAAAKVSASVFNFGSYRYLCFPIGIIIVIASMTNAGSYTEHIKEGLLIVPFFLHIPLQIIIPTLVLIFLLLKDKKVKRGHR